MKISTILTSLLILAFTLNAAEYRSKERVVVAKGDTIASDLFAGSRYLDVYGVVKQDVFAGCERVMIEGEVGDDVIAGCREVQIRGKVGGMVIGFAGAVIIDGEVEGDVLAFSGELLVTENAHIKGNIFLGSGDVRLEGGTVEGNVKGGGGRIFLNGRIGGETDIEAGEIRFGDDYQAAGGTRVKLPHSQKDKDISNAPADLNVTFEKKDYFFQSWFFYWSLLSMLITGVLYLVFFKNFSRDQLIFASRNSLNALGAGFLSLILIPLVIVLFIALILTIPVGLILLVVFLFLLYFSYILSALFLGERIVELFRKNGSPKTLFWYFLAGLISIFLITELPYIGWLLNLIVISFGLGSFILYLWNIRKQTAQTVR